MLTDKQTNKYTNVTNKHTLVIALHHHVGRVFAYKQLRKREKKGVSYIIELHNT